MMLKILQRTCMRDYVDVRGCFADSKGHRFWFEVFARSERGEFVQDLDKGYRGPTNSIIRAWVDIVKPLNLLRIQVSMVLITYLFFTIQVITDWSLVRISGLKGRQYGDSYQVISAATCDQNGISKLYEFKPESPECYYTYGRALIKVVQFLQISVADLTIIAITAIILTLSICASQIFQTINRKNLIISVLATCSPGVWLLLERGNFDWIIFFLVFLAGYASKKDYQIVSAILILITALFKFYTFPLILIPLLLSPRRERYFVLAAAMFVLPFCIIDFRNADVGSLVFTLTASFGVNWIGLLINAIHERSGLLATLVPIEALILGVLITLVFLFVLHKAYTESNLRTISIKSGIHTDPIFLMFSFTYISCYLAGSNFDYRLIFLVGVIVRMLSLLGKFELSHVWLFTLLTSLWLTYAFFGFSNVFTESLRLIGNMSQYVLFFMLTFLFKDGLIELARKSKL